MERRRIARASVLLVFTVCLVEFCSSITTVKADKNATDTAVVQEKKNELKMNDYSGAYKLILNSSSRECYQGYAIDESFLMWFQKNYGGDTLTDIAYALFEGNHHSEIWYQTTGKSIHVLWLEYCKSLNYASYNWDKVIWKDDAGQDGVTTIDIVGDVSFADNWCTMNAMNERTNGILDCFSEDVFQEISGADISVINHEFSVTESDDYLEFKGYNFKADPSSVDYWSYFGVDVLALANNHVYDYKEQGLLDTISYLQQAGYTTLGAGENIKEASYVQYYVINGRKIAIINTTEIERYENLTRSASKTEAGVFKCLDPTILLRTIKKAKANSDYVVTYIHWGREGFLSPDQEMENLAQKMVDAGCDAIVGGHPHRMQGASFVDGVPVVYSVGNFWFSTGSLYTTIAQISISQDGSLSMRMIPCVQRDLYTNILKDEESVSNFYKYVADHSEETGIDADGRLYDISDMDEAEALQTYSYISEQKYEKYNAYLDLDGEKIDAVGNRK